MKLTFYKYQGTGNDFIIIDNRKGKLKENKYKLWERLCNRRFGIGADGLILLQKKKGYDFEMYYVNADGKPTSMCGNGGRCITHFAKEMGVVKGNKAHFIAIDGEHEAVVKGDVVRLKMKNVEDIYQEKNYSVLNTGSPHYVTIVDDVRHTNVFEKGKSIRNSALFKSVGINVNFVEIRSKGIPMLRTYERGVEDETLSCGTGTVAAALVLAEMNKATAKDHCDIQTMGGELRVWFKKDKKGFKNVWLEGPAVLVYEGEIEL
jgi:diaminopimelate epimerase